MAYTVLHSLALMNRGGAETFIMNIFRNIDRNKYKFCFLLNSRNCDYADEIEELGGEIFVIEPRSKGIRSYCKNLDAFFKTHYGEFDAVHVHTSSLSSLEVLYYAKKYDIKRRIIHSHNTKQEGLIHNVLHWFNKPVLSHLATDFLACSMVASEWLYKFTGVLNKVVVVNNGVDVSLFRYNEIDREEIRKKHNIAPDEIVIGHVGRFDVVKNHHFLVDIFDAYQKINPKSKLMCVGVGGTMDSIREKVNANGLCEKVVFAGLQPEVYKYLSAFDYLVFPSLYEGLPVALVEAQASGVMIICSDKVSPEACLTKYLTHYPLEKRSEEWAQYISQISLLNREQWVPQLKENGYDINNTVQLLTDKFYNETF